ncbi:hypothetical protein Tcan_03258 [Toxocara canis]|uniref:Uncharacterized protein n=1 Tax=Toxocara canis TaxID=6265 RepID=A0A0B2VFR8_TOXCA|nr:hypothetical protein Tcan_03258 [Toxocara canis]
MSLAIAASIGKGKQVETSFAMSPFPLEQPSVRLQPKSQQQLRRRSYIPRSLAALFLANCLLE